MNTFFKKFKVKRLNEQIARLEREEAATKAHLDHLTFKALPELREKRNRLIKPGVEMF